eukprot:3130985-Prymnesium_polylepis.1
MQQLICGHATDSPAFVLPPLLRQLVSSLQITVSRRAVNYIGFAPLFDAAVECTSTSGIPLHAIVNPASVQCASRISDQRR